MSNENEVQCWCCEYYWQYDENESQYCTLSELEVSPHDPVCADFLLNSGLHTSRTIPDYCENYK